MHGVPNFLLTLCHGVVAESAGAAGFVERHASIGGVRCCQQEWVVHLLLERPSPSPHLIESI